MKGHKITLLISNVRKERNEDVLELAQEHYCGKQNMKKYAMVCKNVTVINITQSFQKILKY